MDNSFPYGDIIVIGAIAAFILLRYRAMLGEPRGRDERSTPPPIIQAGMERDRLIQLPVVKTAIVEKKQEDNFSRFGAQADTLVAMRALDREFTPEEFLSGARTAYEMVITAYGKRDRETLRQLLSPELYVSFDRGLTQEESDKRYTDTTLVSIEEATFTTAKLEGSKATLAVNFTSEQVHLVRDEHGTILEGNPSAQSKVEDHWVFTRDMKSNSPNWLIVET